MRYAMTPQSQLRLTTIESHTCGHPTRVVVDGLPSFAGVSVAEQRACARGEFDHLRTFLCREPRGHGAMYAAYVVPSQVADVGVVFASQVGYDDMCGHGTIGAVTALCENGRLPRDRPVRLETPAGVVTAEPHWSGRRVEAVSFDSVPAFLYERDVSVQVPEVGEVRGDVAFGGNWYLYVDAATIGTSVDAAGLPALVRLGAAIKEARNGVAEVVHPLHAQIARSLIGVSFYGPPQRDPGADQINVVVESEVFYDRSPCGTGTCGRMAVLHARGELAVGAEFRNEGIAGGTFSGSIAGLASVGPFAAVQPRLTGSAWIMGEAQWTLDPTDPLGTAGW